MEFNIIEGLIIQVIFFSFFAAVFLKISPVRQIKKYETAVNYFSVFFFIFVIAASTHFLFTSSAFTLSIANSLIIIGYYVLYFGLKSRKSLLETHIYKSKIVIINTLLVVVVSSLTYGQDLELNIYRSIFIGLNLMVITFFCSYQIIKQSRHSTVEKFTAIVFVLCGLSESLHWLPLYFTGDFILHGTVTLFLQVTYFFMIFGSLLSLLLSDTVNFHYKSSITDQLTGIFNRRYLMEQGGRLLSRQTKNTTSATVIITDIDKFKLVNDTYGHAVGDQVIIQFTKLLVNMVRPEDLVARIGGEEFVILMNNSTVDEAADIADRIREELSELWIEMSQKKFRVTASFGVSTIVNGNLESTIKAADDALYKAKNNGRNQVMINDIL